MSQFKRNLAIIIGINNYQHGIPTLKTATKDAEKIAKILQKQHGYKIWGLLDEQATLASCLRLLEEFLPHKIQESDRLIFYFAGHGIALNGDDGPEGFLIPQDAQLGDTNTYLPMVRLQKALINLPCRHFLGIFDCCFAGAFRWSSTRDLLIAPEVIHQEHYDRFIEAAAWQVITSASHDQKAFDSLDLQDHRGITDSKHSPFAAALIEALQGSADSTPPGKDGKPPGDGVITATELYLYLRDRVEIATSGKRKRQTPGLYPLNKHDRGEYIFLTPEHELNLPAAPPLDESQNPYRGLESFDCEHSDLFFGRTALTQKLYRFCQENPLTVVLGASGTGKSSLVKAGLIPYLQQLDTADQWQILPPMRPGESAFKELNKILTEHESSGSSILSVTSLERKKKVLSGKIRYLLNRAPQSKLLLVVDQTEELITLSQNQAERDDFLALLAEWLKKYPQQLRIVLTLRSDFEPQFRNLVFKSSWQQARFIVPAMTREELREAIEKPASARVMYFEPYSLVERLIDEVAQMPGALPLLSFALSELYLKYLQKFRSGIRDKRAITQEDYAEIGGVTQSLTQRADREYAELVQQDPAYAQTIRYVMLRMIALGGGELARRRVLLSELEYPEPENARVKKIVKGFSTARLLVKGQNTQEQPYVEPAHDALVRGWQKLLMWKQEEEESLILQRRLTPVAEEWKNLEHKKSRSGLLTKTEPIINWLDARLYNVENLFDLINIQFLRVLRRMSNKENRLIAKPKDFLWHANPYLNVLKEKLNSSNYWFNRIEVEFVKRSLKRKRINRRLSIISVSIVLGFISLTIYISIRTTETIITRINTEAKNKVDEIKKDTEEIIKNTKESLKISEQAKQEAEKALDGSNDSLAFTKESLKDTTKALEGLETALQTSNKALEETQKALEEERKKTSAESGKETSEKEDLIDPEEQPDSVNPEEQPDSTNPDEQPDSANPEEQPDSTNPDEQPDSVNPEEQPDSVNPEEQPDSTNPEEQPDSTNPDEQPDSVNPEEQPDSVNPEEQPDSTNPDEQPDSANQEEQPDSVNPEEQPDSVELKDSGEFFLDR